MIQSFYTFPDELFKLCVSRFLAVGVEELVLEAEIDILCERLLFSNLKDEAKTTAELLDVFRCRKVPIEKGLVHMTRE